MVKGKRPSGLYAQDTPRVFLSVYPQRCADRVHQTLRYHPFTQTRDCFLRASLSASGEPVRLWRIRRCWARWVLAGDIREVAFPASGALICWRGFGEELG